MPRLASAFEIDRLLRRTVLFVIPVEQLDEVAFTRLFPVPDLCVALMTFLPNGRVSKEKVGKQSWGASVMRGKFLFCFFQWLGLCSKQI